MRLLRTEFLRFWSRRMTWGILGVSLLLSVAGVLIGFTQASADPPVQPDRADVDNGCVAEILRGVEANIDFGPPVPAGLNDAELRAFVEDEYCRFTPYVEDRRFFATTILDGESRNDGRSDWSDSRPTAETDAYRNGPNNEVAPWAGLQGILPLMSIAFLVISVIAGASFMGAEYRAGTVENLLLWEPRRVRVMFAKFVAGGLSSFAMTVVVMSVLSALLYGLASVRGSTEGVDGRFMLDLVSVIGRASLMGALFFVMAMAIATIFRTTTASIFAILGWFVVSNIVLELLLKGLAPWELFRNATAFINEGQVGRYESQRGEAFLVFHHDYLAAGLVVAGWAAVLGTIGVVLFARRDVS